MQSEYTKTQLDNGLQVLLKEIHSAPLISQWVWYKVGSRDEIPGITGISHWVEHMLFKGTERFPSGQLDKDIARHGGYSNAMTYIDWTTYFATMPADKSDLILEMESDRMANSLFVQEDVDSERTVIISEREGSENSPVFRLHEQIQETAFDQHSYGHEVIGVMQDLETIRREDLFEHYKKYYVPSNAVLTIAGDFDSESMLARVHELFDPIQDGTLPERQITPEPPQTKERRLTVEGPGETTFISMAYHAPNALDDDFFTFTVLDSLLTGPSSLNMFGSGISNKTSRLYQALVDKEMAVSIGGGLFATIDPYIYSITLTLHPDRSPDEVIQAFDDQIKKLQDNLTSPAELARAVKQARALFAYGSESISNQAFWLGFAEVFSDYEWFLTYIEKLAAVTPQEIQRLAQTYLQSHNRTLGVYSPTGVGEELA